MQSNLNRNFFIVSTFAVANPGTLGSSLQVFIEASLRKTEAPQQSQKTSFSALYSAFSFFGLLTHLIITYILRISSKYGCTSAIQASLIAFGLHVHLLIYKSRLKGGDVK